MRGDLHFSREKNSERCRRKMLFGENLLSLFKSNQSQSYVIYSQSKVKAKLIYILSFVPACVLSPLHCMQNCQCLFVLCLSAVLSGFGLVSVMSELHLRIQYLHYLIEFVIFYTSSSFELFYLASLRQLCISRH